jgi:hypothetical protein
MQALLSASWHPHILTGVNLGGTEDPLESTEMTVDASLMTVSVAKTSSAQ